VFEVEGGGEGSEEVEQIKTRNIITTMNTSPGRTTTEKTHEKSLKTQRTSAKIPVENTITTMHTSPNRTTAEKPCDKPIKAIHRKTITEVPHNQIQTKGPKTRNPSTNREENKKNSQIQS